MAQKITSSHLSEFYKFHKSRCINSESTPKYDKAFGECFWTIAKKLNLTTGSFNPTVSSDDIIHHFDVFEAGFDKVLTKKKIPGSIVHSYFSSFKSWVKATDLDL